MGRVIYALHAATTDTTPMTVAAPTTPNPSADKRRYVREMFSAIAPRYDLLNHLLSLNIDRSWRRRAVSRLGWERRPDGLYLDACAGTFDFALALARRPGFRGRIVAADFAVPMLRLGALKATSAPIGAAAADSLQFPFADGTFDGALVGWGIRNLSDVDAGFAELLRVLQPGARLVVLDSTTPPRSPLRPLYLFYFQRVLPIIGRAVSGHRTAYSYLPDSVREFPQAEELKQRMERAGFRDCGYDLPTGGVVAINWGAR